MADVCEEGSEMTKKKGSRWSSEMIGNLVTCLMAYKARMEYQALDFDGDRPAQYKELRKELAKLCLTRCFYKALSRGRCPG